MSVTTTERGSGFNPSREDFAALLDESYGDNEAFEGTVVKGTVVAIEKDVAVIDIGLKTEGRVPMREFVGPGREAAPKVGDEVEVYLERVENALGEAVISRDKARREESWVKLEKAFEANEKVDGVIFNQVKGGFTVDLDGAVAFLPRSQVDIRPIRDVTPLMGVPQPFQILKMDRRRGNIVVSRRTVLEESRAEQRHEIVANLEEGQVIDGTVKNITDYGAFVDLGGLDGLLHVTDMSWGRLQHPSEAVKVGDKVKVVVLKYDPTRERVSLGMKQIMTDPWTQAATSYPPGARFRGKVVSVTDYGAFVELEKGVEGLIHVSEMSWSKRAVHPSKVVNPGDMVEVQVLGVDEGNRRISLGLKQTEPNPWQELSQKHPVGTHVTGKVKSITDFGVFVEIEAGIDGLVHISDLSWTKKIRHPSEVYKKGDEVAAIVLGIEVENERVSLGVKQLTPDPWTTVAQRYPLNTRIKGKVSSVADFGVFVEIEEGIEGLIHISQLSNERVDKPSSLYKADDEVDALVVQVDSRERRIGLSVKALKQHEEREEMQAYLKREHEAARFSMEDILNEELKLDRDDAGRSASRVRGRDR